MTVVLGWGFESSLHNTCSTYSRPGQTTWLSVLTDQGTVVFIYMICCLLLSCPAVVLRPFHQCQTSQIGLFRGIFPMLVGNMGLDLSTKGDSNPAWPLSKTACLLAQQLTSTPGQLVLITGATQIGCRCLNWEVQKPGVMTNTSTGTW